MFHKIKLTSSINEKNQRNMIESDQFKYQITENIYDFKHTKTKKSL